MSMDSLMGKFRYTPILSVKVSVKKIKGAAHKTVTLTVRVNKVLLTTAGSLARANDNFGSN